VVRGVRGWIDTFRGETNKLRWEPRGIVVRRARVRNSLRAIFLGPVPITFKGGMWHFIEILM